MQTGGNNSVKTWGMPVFLLVITVVGLISAILGTGGWHWFSWFSLGVPMAIMIWHGIKFFK